MALKEEEPQIKKARATKTPSVKLVEAEERMKTSSATCRVQFAARQLRLKNWDAWVDKLCSVHQSTWKGAGIYEAIMSSKYAIKRHNDLILELASRWCTRTSSFVFPWGEATLTLEDLLVLGGFSALGVSALCTVENEPKSLEIVERLEVARMGLVRTRAQSACPGKWLEKFKDCGSDLEHTAFLSLWLSRFVFPHSAKVLKHVFPAAAQLSRGIKIALGPAVLAVLYQDLSTLKTWLNSGDNIGQVDLCGLFHLVQLWAWERFPMLKPVPNCVLSGQNFPRSARWSNVKISKEIDLRSAIDSAEKTFLWRPYASSAKHKCMETRELRGFDSCIVRYQPQRVARQFGLDQEQQKYPTSLQVKVEEDADSPPPGFPPRIEVIDVVDSDSDDDDEVGQVQLQHTALVPLRSMHGSNEAMDFVNRSVQGRSTEFDAESYTTGVSTAFDLEAQISRLEEIVYALEGQKYATLTRYGTEF